MIRPGAAARGRGDAKRHARAERQYGRGQADRRGNRQRARQHLLHDDFTGGLLRRLLRRPWGILGSKAGDLSALLSQHWDVSLALRELPAHPRWMINATCYETGKNWRFERFRMGDYVFGYSHDTDVPLSDALAASAGFPGLIGPLVMDTTRHSWFRSRQPARG